MYWPFQLRQRIKARSDFIRQQMKAHPVSVLCAVTYHRLEMKIHDYLKIAPYSEAFIFNQNQ
jgi:hypothetical protein